MMYVKGYVIGYMPVFLEERFGGYGLNKWMHSLNHQAFDIYNGGIGKTDWYPLKIALVQPAEKACEIFYNKSLRGAIDFGRYIAERENKKEIKFLPFKSSPVSRVKKACDALQSIYDSGEVALVDLNDTGATIRITNFPEMSEIIEVMTAGWLQKTIEHELGKTVAIEIKNPSDSRTGIEYLVKWKN